MNKIQHKIIEKKDYFTVIVSAIFTALFLFFLNLAYIKIFSNNIHDISLLLYVILTSVITTIIFIKNFSKPLKYKTIIHIIKDSGKK